MEGDRKKRSRAVESGSGGGGRRKKERETKGNDARSVAVVVSSPTEDEFDEFFAILQRMKEAVKYFQKSTDGGEGGSEFSNRLLKTEEPPSRGVNDAGVGVKKSGDAAVLDLNTVPEGEN